MSEKKIKIIIAEDHKLVRAAFISLIEDQHNMRVIAEAGDGQQLLEKLQTHEPDIVLLDIEMPVMNGYDALKQIRKNFPAVKVIMLSMHSEIALMSNYITMGAMAYISKGEKEDTFLNAIHTVYGGAHYLTPETAALILDELKNEKKMESMVTNMVLSRREIQILKELCLGKTNKEIADVLNVTPTTISFHRGNIYKKTKSRNIADLIKYGIKYGVISTGGH